MNNFRMILGWFAKLHVLDVLKMCEILHSIIATYVSAQFPEWCEHFPWRMIYLLWYLRSIQNKFYFINAVNLNITCWYDRAEVRVWACLIHCCISHRSHITSLTVRWESCQESSILSELTPLTLGFTFFSSQIHDAVPFFVLPVFLSL